MLPLKENDTLSRLFHSLIVEYIQNKDYLKLKIFLYLIQNKLIAREKECCTIHIDKDEMAKSCGVSSRVLLNHLKEIKSLTLVSENKQNNQVEYITPFHSLSIVLDEPMMELGIFQKYYISFRSVLERYIYLELSPLFILKTRNAIKMFELLQNIEEDKVYTLDELNLLFETNYKSSKELIKKSLNPLVQEFYELLNVEFIFELLSTEKKSSILVNFYFEKLKHRKNKKQEEFIAWLTIHKSVLLLSEEISHEEKLDPHASWQEKVTFKMDRLAQYLGF